MGYPTYDNYGNPIEINISDSADNSCPSCAALRARVAVLEKVVNLYSALFRGATPNTDMIIVTREAYDEINAALDALKEGK